MRRFVLQEVVEASGRKVLCFIKLHAPWPVLCHYAEELNMRAPLQVSRSPFRPLYFSRLHCLSAGVKDMCVRARVFFIPYMLYIGLGNLDD
jgi:Dimerisation domain of Ca+-activated chloride-channel, anoctamin